MSLQAVYVHIPFCPAKCNYCDFVSFPLAETQAESRRYPALLKQELELWAQRLDFSGVQTLYFGGGTPTALPTDALLDILAAVQRHCTPSEITVEANPATIDGAGLRRLRAGGCNRISIGVQSFDDANLRRMGRLHGAADSRKLIEEARQAGFCHISIDLIYGLPGQTLAAWQQDLATALALDIDHISLYGLSLSPDSPWGQALNRGEMELPDSDICADMLEHTLAATAGAGFEHYEISNFARPGHACRHNLAYWQRLDYLGLGLAAASCLGRERFCNLKTLPAYAAALAAGGLPVEERESLSEAELYSEAMFLGLRLLAGVSLPAFQARYGVDPQSYFAEAIEENLRQGLLEKSGQRLRLSRRGFFLANTVFASFL